MSAPRILLLGGTGHVGRAVLRAEPEAVFTYCAGDPAGLPGVPLRCDLEDPEAVPRLFAELDARGLAPDAVILAARLRPDPAEAEGRWLERALRVQVGAMLGVCRELERRPRATLRNVVALGALDRGQSLPMAPALAAVQGALGATAMALGHELAAAGLRVNVVALGLLDGGASASVTAPQVRSYQHFAALRRVGTAEEVAATLRWLAHHNRVINGKVLSANGGL